MKLLFTFALGFTMLFAISQKTNENYPFSQYKNTTCRAYFEKIILEGANSERSICQYLKKNIPNLKDYRTGLKLNYLHESPGGFHYSFTQTFNEIEIYQSEIKVNLDRKNIIHSVFDNSENTSSWDVSITNIHNDVVIAVRNATPVLCERKIKNNSIEVLEANGETVFERDANAYFAIDSMVSGKVFKPDPLTSSQHSYGLPYFDNLDANNSALEAELKTVSFMTRFDGSQFTLQSDFVRLSDFDAPFVAPVTSGINQFYYNRSQSGFEDVNVYYHISAMQHHINSLGFGCADSLVDVDPHAVSGADQSYFSPLQNPKRLYYGTGGVDDAEDADVCIHEYGHFVSEIASPGSNVGQQRNSIDEGFGDYLAGSYSKSLSSFSNNWVFNWDGHNEFWNGRVLDASWKYPDDLTNSIYHNGQIWGAVLWCINGTIGTDATDSLILQAHYSYAQNMSMPNAAQLLIDADTLLTGGKYTCAIYSCLFYRGLAPNNPLIDCNVGIQEEENFPVQFLNLGNCFLLSNPGNQKIQLQIINIAGQTVATVGEVQSVFSYSNSNLQPGIYLVKVEVNGAAKTFKWSKVN